MHWPATGVHMLLILFVSNFLPYFICHTLVTLYLSHFKNLQYTINGRHYSNNLFSC